MGWDQLQPAPRIGGSFSCAGKVLRKDYFLPKGETGLTVIFYRVRPEINDLTLFIAEWPHHYAHEGFRFKGLEVRIGGNSHPSIKLSIGLQIAEIVGLVAVLLQVPIWGARQSTIVFIRFTAQKPAIPQYVLG